MYRIFDLSLDSEMLLPELPAGAGGGAAIRVAVGTGRALGESPVPWLHEWHADDAKTEVTMAVARTGAGFVLRFPERADFTIDVERGRIEVRSFGDTSESTVRHLLLDQVIPRMMGQRGELVLHASAIELPEGSGVVFIGKSGRGKSTLASSFFRSGSRLVTDDCLLLAERDGRLAGIPSYAGSRLWSDSARALFPRHRGFRAVSGLSEKKRLILHDHAESNGEIAVRAVFVLGDPGEGDRSGAIRVDRIEGAEAIMALIRCGFMLDVKDMSAAARQFASAGRIATASPAVYSLDYPRDFGRLPDVRQAIVSALARSAGVGRRSLAVGLIDRGGP